MQQAIVELGTHHLDALGQQEGFLELPRGDAAMQEGAIALVGLLAAENQLVLLDGDRQIAVTKTGDR